MSCGANLVVRRRANASATCSCSNASNSSNRNRISSNSTRLVATARVNGLLSLPQEREKKVRAGVRTFAGQDPNSPPGRDGPPEPEGDLGILPNTGRYFLYFISVLTGTAYVAFRPVFKFMAGSPLKILLVLGTSVLSYQFVSFTVAAMLGTNGDPFGGPVHGGNGGF